MRRSDGVIVDIDGAREKLGKPSPTPGGKPIPLKVGDSLELNDHRAIVVGIAKVTRTFQSQPVVYTTYSRAKSYAPKERKLLSFVLVKAKQGQDLAELTRRIRATTGLAAYTREEFMTLTYEYFMHNTGIPINFGISVLLGFYRRRGHCRPDLLQLHSGKLAPIRRSKSDGHQQLDFAAHDFATGGFGGHYRLRFRRGLDRIVRLFDASFDTGVQVSLATAAV